MNSPTFDPRRFGARGDGTSLDTLALQRALDEAFQAGGGRVVLEGGTFLSSTLFLRSNVELRIEAGAVLKGAPDKDLYFGPRDEPDVHVWDFRWLHALLVGEDATNIALTGEGVIDGDNVFDPQGEEGMRGPHLVLLRRCQGVTLRDLSLRHAANYAFLMYACQNVSIENAAFEGGWDGVHFRDHQGAWNRDLRVSNCRFLTGDDAIAGACVEDAHIEGCLINTACNGFRLIGPARRLTLERCRFIGPGVYPHRLAHRFNTLAALNVQPGAWEPWPGPLEDVRFADLEMERVECAFHVAVRQGNTAQGLAFERIRATLDGPHEAASSLESWTDAPLRDVVVRDVQILASGGQTSLPDQSVTAPHVGTRPLPVTGLYAHGVEGLLLERLDLPTRAPDARAATRFDGVTGLEEIEGELQAPRVPESVPRLT